MSRYNVRKSRLLILKSSIGMTFMEILLSLVLGMIILSSLIQIYWAVHHANQVQQSFILLQENANMSDHLLSQHIRLAGYAGCGKLTANFPFTNHTRLMINEKNKIQPEEHELTVWHALPAIAKVTKAMQNTFTIEVEALDEIKPQQILFISDCKTIELFQIKEVNLKNNQIILMTNYKLKKKFKKNAELYPLEIDNFYLAKENSAHPGLFLKNKLGETFELIEGITQMDIHYDVVSQGKYFIKSARKLAAEDNIVGISIKFMQEKDIWYDYIALYN